MRNSLRRFLWRHGGEYLALAARLAELPLRRFAGFLTRRAKRDDALCVFGAARNRFGDNTAYLYLFLAARPAVTRCVWITGSGELRNRLRAAGLEAEKRWSFQGMRACLRARWYVISSYTSDVNRWLADGATIVNLWHGVPLKRIERDIAGGPLRFLYDDRQPMRAAFADQTRTPDLLLAPSSFVAERCFVSAFAIPLDRCLSFGYPRTDHFLRPRDEPPHELLVRDSRAWHRLRKRRRVVGYFPTFRDDDVGAATPGGLDLDRLVAALDAIGAHLVFKPHVVSVSSVAPEGATTLAYQDDADAYLPLCDVLVTDYSSLAFDFMLLDRPIVYFVPDLDDYAHYRGFYFKPSEMMPGRTVRDPEELVAAVEAALDDGPDPRMHEVRRLVWGEYAGDACEQLRSLLEETPRTPRPFHGSPFATS
jgi:CDP-glycerol glycerophosphotransferase (TagB/SpsB family)